MAGVLPPQLTHSEKPSQTHTPRSVSPSEVWSLLIMKTAVSTDRGTNLGIDIVSTVTRDDTWGLDPSHKLPSGIAPEESLSG